MRRISKKKPNNLKKEDNKKSEYIRDMRTCLKETLKIHLIDYQEVKIIMGI